MKIRRRRCCSHGCGHILFYFYRGYLGITRLHLVLLRGRYRWRHNDESIPQKVNVTEENYRSVYYSSRNIQLDISEFWSFTKQFKECAFSQSNHAVLELSKCNENVYKYKMLKLSRIFEGPSVRITTIPVVSSVSVFSFS